MKVFRSSGRRKDFDCTIFLCRLAIELIIIVTMLKETFSEVHVINEVKIHVTEQINAAFNAYKEGDASKSLEIMRRVVLIAPNDIDANQFIGTILVKMEEPLEGSEYLHRAVELSNWEQSHILANYVESLRMSGNLVNASVVCARGTQLHPNSTQILFNAAIVARDMKDYSFAKILLRKIIETDRTYYLAWYEGGQAMIASSNYDEAESFLSEAIIIFPGDSHLLASLGLSKHHQYKFNDALLLYNQSLSIKPDNYVVMSSVAAAYQSLGRSQEAAISYEACMPFRPEDASIRSNYGVLLLSLGQHREGLAWLLEALVMEPLMESALSNLGSFYQDDGLLTLSKEYFTKAASLSEKSILLKLRIAVMLSPILSSWESMIEQRMEVEEALLVILSSEPPVRQTLDSSLDRIHFYLVYHGLNDRYMQELIVSAYHRCLADFSYINPKLLPAPLSPVAMPLTAAPSTMNPMLTVFAHNLSGTSSVSVKKVRVAFISLFFGIFEPHGMLLDGVMALLPRSEFEVIALPIARTDGKPLSPRISDSCDEVVETSLFHSDLRAQVSSLDLDILVFADTMSEPMTHFLAHSRLAPVQMAFWGNPITSGSASIDYFVSGDLLEHPHRTRMPRTQEPYTEQVVLLGGQGVWYNTPEDPEIEMLKAGLALDRMTPRVEYSKGYFNIPNRAFVYLCPQSVFKMHPLFDLVFRDILLQNPEGYLVVTGGRRPKWTEIYSARLQGALGPVLMQRLHVVERVSAEKFLGLLKIADVMLHPFPFDGSRTSADGLIAGIPVLTMPTEYLRGRMGATFLRTMNLPDLVAKSRSNYVDIAVRLWKDKDFYSSCVTKIKERVHLIWEDLEYAFSWYQLLCTSVGQVPLSWEGYVLQSGRNLTAETAKRDLCRDNRRAFSAVWGEERWLLRNNVAHLESHLTSRQVPWVFNDWHSEANATEGNHSMAAESQGGDSQPVPRMVNRDETTADVSHSLRTQIISEVTDHLTVPPSTVSDHHTYLKDEEVGLAEMKELARVWQLADSYQVALILMQSSTLRSNPLFLLDVGGVQYFRGEYSSAYSYCREAATLAPDSILAQECMGASGMYVEGEQAAALTALRLAWYMQQQQQVDPLDSDIFNFSPESVLLNLLSALNSAGHYTTCMNMLCEALGLPMLEEGGTYIICFASVDWSAGSVESLTSLGLNLTLKGRLKLDGGAVFYDEILRVQRTALHLVTVGMLCIPKYLEELSGPGSGLMKEVVTELYRVVLKNKESQKDSAAQLPSLPSELQHDVVNNSVPYAQGDADQPIIHDIDRIVLITQYFQAPSTSQALQQDVDKVLALNLANPLISSIVLLTESLLDLTDVDEKIRQVVIGERLTFSTAFSYANEHLSGCVVILANADIYFDDSLHLLSRANTPKLGPEIMALLKWTQTGPPPPASSSAHLSLRTDSQDAWVFRPPLLPSVLQESQFLLGMPRCDNRIAEVLSIAGYRVFNPAFAVHAIEVHTRDRGPAPLYGTKGAVPGTTRNVLLSDRHSF